MRCCVFKNTCTQVPWVTKDRANTGTNQAPRASLRKLNMRYRSFRSQKMRFRMFFATVNFILLPSHSLGENFGVKMNNTIDLTKNTGCYTIVLASASIEICSVVPMLVITPRDANLVVNVESKEQNSAFLDDSFVFCPLCPLTMCDCGENAVQSSAESTSEVSRKRNVNSDCDEEKKLKKTKYASQLRKGSRQRRQVDPLDPVCLYLFNCFYILSLDSAVEGLNHFKRVITGSQYDGFPYVMDNNKRIFHIHNNKVFHVDEDAAGYVRIDKKKYKREKLFAMTFLRMS